MIKEAALRLGRSYSWVYDFLKRVGNAGCYRDDGVIYINRRGFKLLEGFHRRAPRRGRPAGGKVTRNRAG
jgi:hypothetical protein